MEAGSVIGRAWELYKAHWRHLIPIALIVYVLVSTLTYDELRGQEEAAPAAA